MLSSRVFKTKAFRRWAHKTRLTDTALLRCVAEMEAGLIHADLGGGLFKQRILLPGSGKSGGARIILATRFHGRCFFLFGFEKKDRDNATPRELALYRRLAAELLEMNDAQIAAALAGDVLTEVTP